MWDLAKTIIMSLCFILLCHYTFLYLKANYTTPVTKDVLTMQTQKYKNIINTLNESNIVSPPEEIEDDLLNHALSQL